MSVKLVDDLALELSVSLVLSFGRVWSYMLGGAMYEDFKGFASCGF
jgi:hypothetical protein